MAPETTLPSIAKQTWLEPLEEGLQKGLAEAFKSDALRGKPVENALHGVWLGHPLHPALVGIPLGAWTVAFVLDLVEEATGERHLRRGADLLSLAGRQELGSFWERVIMPQVLYMLTTRFGGAGAVNRARRSRDKIANGQYLCFTRVAYDSLGGHESVRGKAAEDLALAQLVHARGLRGELSMGPNQLSTRMYTSLAEVVNGWTKNIVTAGADTLPPGVASRLLVPLLLLVVPVMHLAPVATLIASAFVPLSAPVVMWARVCTMLLAAWWAFIYVRVFRLSPLYALALPLGALMVLYIIARATVRGRAVEWKGRRYQAG